MARSTPALEIHRDEGEGAAVVLLHGFPDTASTWDGIADTLVADGHRVVVPHLRGYTPTSIRPGRPYDARTLAEDVIGLLDDLGLDSATLVGHDWGASMAYGAASLSPDRVDRLVGVAIPHPRTVKPTPALLWKARHFVTLKLPWASRQFALADLSGVDILYRRWAPGWSGPERDACVANVKAAMADPDVLDATLAYYRALSPRPDRALTHRLGMPSLVVGGTRDLVPPESFEASRSAFTGPVEVLVLDGAGHWPHREREPAFVDALRTFLD
ncbi:MAG: alpha/beta hydrolase [Actinomycetota bacterium]